VIVDENGARTLFRNLADTEAPPARVDIGRAIVQGRRSRRLRRTGAGGSTLAIGALVGVIFTQFVVTAPTGTAVPSARMSESSTTSPTFPSSTSPMPHSTTSPIASPIVSSSTSTGGPPLATPPHAFNPLVPYASFGWLPQGYAAALPGGAATSVDSTSMTAEGHNNDLWLHVMATGACTRSGSVLNCYYGTGDRSSGAPFTGQAPAVNGRPAYWDSFCELVWEYAPDAWASLHLGCQGAVPESMRSVMSKVAAGVTYADSTALRVPFWVSGLPVGWPVSATTFTDSPSVLSAASVTFGPPVYPAAVTISVTSSSAGPGCSFMPGSRYVTVDGVRGILQATPTGYAELLCVNNVNGQQITVNLQERIPGTGAPVPGAAGLGGAVGVASMIHLLGADPAGWTTNPLR